MIGKSVVDPRSSRFTRSSIGVRRLVHAFGRSEGMLAAGRDHQLISPIRVKAPWELRR
jgi:hypothetical protein